MNTFLLSIIGIPAIEIYLFIKLGSQIGALTQFYLFFLLHFLVFIMPNYEGFNTLQSGMSQMVKNELQFMKLFLEQP